VSDFGDFDPDDAFGVEPPDPEQVAKKLQELIARRSSGRERRLWDQLPDDFRRIRIEAIAELFDWLRRQGAMR
jgi:hypothetical protein